jgi:hypothetical protein
LIGRSGTVRRPHTVCIVNPARRTRPPVPEVPPLTGINGDLFGTGEQRRACHAHSRCLFDDTRTYAQACAVRCGAIQRMWPRAPAPRRGPARSARCFRVRTPRPCSLQSISVAISAHLLNSSTAWSAKRSGTRAPLRRRMPFTAYGLTKLAIRYIARRRGNTVKMSEDHDLTDYAALETFIDRFAARARASTQKPAEAAQRMMCHHSFDLGDVELLELMVSVPANLGIGRWLARNPT